MDYQAWIDGTWDTSEARANLLEQMTQDLQQQLEANGLKLLKTVPHPFAFSAVAEDANGHKWLHILTQNVQEREWFDNVSLRRMSSQTDWKGDEFHYCRWSELGENAAKYMGSEYDDEAL